MTITNQELREAFAHNKARKARRDYWNSPADAAFVRNSFAVCAASIIAAVALFAWFVARLALEIYA